MGRSSQRPVPRQARESVSGLLALARSLGARDSRRVPRSGWIGGLLVLGGAALWIAAGAIRGDVGPAGTGLRALGDAMTGLSLALACSGAAVLSVTGPRPLQDPGVRLGLGIVAVGLAALAVATLIPIPAGSNSLQSWPYIISVGLGLAATGGGSVLVV